MLDWTRIPGSTVSYSTSGSTVTGLVFRKDDPEPPPTFGVREPRRPIRPTLSGSAALELVDTEQGHSEGSVRPNAFIHQAPGVPGNGH